MKNTLLQHLHFAFYVVIATALLIAWYVANLPDPQELRSQIYQVSLFGYYGFAVVLVALLTLPLSLSVFTRWIFPILCWVWLLYLIIDVVVYDLYGFHVNLLILEMFIFDFKGMGIPVFILVLAAVLAILLLVLIAFFHRVAAQPNKKIRVVARVVLILTLPLFLIQTLISVWGHRYEREEITRLNNNLPVFFPITSHKRGVRLAEAFPSIFPPVTGQGGALYALEANGVRYPIERPRCASNEKDSIIMIVLESWQADALQPEIMPNLYQFANQSNRYAQHLSSGSTTVPGLFGLLYGLHGSYHDHFKSAPNSHPALLTDLMHEHGYLSKVFTSSKLDRFALRTLFFSKVDDSHYFDATSDRQLIDQYLAELRNPVRKSQPNFDFLFLTSSHASYRYPEDFARFQPLPIVEGGYALNKQADNAPYKNDYYNSLYYLDSLLGEIFRTLETTGELDRSWVVITGDHAEEFNETGLGHWGHGSNFSRWQTQVPLVVRAPQQEKGETITHVSTHQDIAPTLIQSALKCAGEVSNFSNGVHLSQLPGLRSTVLSSYFIHAYWIDGVVYERTTGKKYDWETLQEIDTLTDSKTLRELMQSERRFLHTGE